MLKQVKITAMKLRLRWAQAQAMGVEQCGITTANEGVAPDLQLVVVGVMVLCYVGQGY